MNAISKPIVMCGIVFSARDQLFLEEAIALAAEETAHGLTPMPRLGMALNEDWWRHVRCISREMVNDLRTQDYRPNG
jgi:hypothetical protein